MDYQYGNSIRDAQLPLTEHITFGAIMRMFAYIVWNLAPIIKLVRCRIQKNVPVNFFQIWLRKKKTFHELSNRQACFGSEALKDSGSVLPLEFMVKYYHSILNDHINPFCAAVGI